MLVELEVISLLMTSLLIVALTKKEQVYCPASVSFRLLIV